MSIELVMLSSHLILCRPLLLLPSVFLGSRVFSNESALCIRWPNYWNFSISPSNDYSDVIPFGIDWFDLLAVQGTFKSFLQHHNLKAPSTQPSLWSNSYLSYMTTWKTIALTLWTFINKAVSLLFNTLSRFVIVFLPRSKHLLISWLQSPSAVILKPRKLKSVTASTFSSFYLPWSYGTGCHDLNFSDVEFQASFFTVLFHPHEEALQFLFTFCHQGGIIYVSEVVDISLGNVDSNLRFIQHGISHDVLRIFETKLIIIEYNFL